MVELETERERERERDRMKQRKENEGQRISDKRIYVRGKKASLCCKVTNLRLLVFLVLLF